MLRKITMTLLAALAAIGALVSPVGATTEWSLLQVGNSHAAVQLSSTGALPPVEVVFASRSEEGFDPQLLETPNPGLRQYFARKVTAVGQQHNALSGHVMSCPSKGRFFVWSLTADFQKPPCAQFPAAPEAAVAGRGRAQVVIAPAPPRAAVATAAPTPPPVVAAPSPPPAPMPLALSSAGLGLVRGIPSAEVVVEIALSSNQMAVRREVVVEKLASASSPEDLALRAELAGLKEVRAEQAAAIAALTSQLGEMQRGMAAQSEAMQKLAAQVESLASPISASMTPSLYLPMLLLVFLAVLLGVLCLWYQRSATLHHKTKVAFERAELSVQRRIEEARCLVDWMKGPLVRMEALVEAAGGRDVFFSHLNRVIAGLAPVMQPAPRTQSVRPAPVTQAA